MRLYLVIGFIVCYTCIQILNKGPREGLWHGWLVALLILPVFAEKRFGAFVLNMRMIAAFLGIGAVFFMKPPTGHFKLVPVDIAIALFIGVQLISEYLINNLTITMTPYVVSMWGAPYMVGRIFLGSPYDSDRIVKIAAVLCLIVPGLAVFEALTRFNPVCKIMSKRFPKLERGEGYRWGMKRAQVGMTHPIYFGMVMVMTFPWALEARRLKKLERKKHPYYYYFLPFAVFASIFVTCSRGPIIACLATWYIFGFFRAKHLRLTLFLVLVFAGGGAAVSKDAIVELLGKTAGAAHDKQKWIEIKGQMHLYSGTRHRILLDLVYEDAIKQCSLFGYGQRLKGVTVEEHLQHRFASIDNHYLLFFLQRGPVGIYCFVILFIVSFLSLGWVGWNPERYSAPLAGALCGSLMAVTALLRSVWFAPDLGNCWMFLCGLAGCLFNLRHVGPNAIGYKKKGKRRNRPQRKTELDSREGDDKRSTDDRHVPAPKGRRPARAPARRRSTGAAPRREIQFD